MFAAGKAAKPLRILILGGTGFTTLLVVFLTLRRAANFAIARPAREILFTVVSREDKYKAKNLIDTFVYRAADQMAAWSTPVMGWLGFGLAGVSLVAAPIAAVWLLISLWLGRKLRMAREVLASTSTPAIDG